MRTCRSQALAISLAVAALGSTASAQEGGGAPTSDLEPQDRVTDALADLDADCYLFTGEEDWEEPNGTLVRMPVAVFNVEAASAEEPPVVFFPGGPGCSSLGNRAYLEQLLKDVGDRTRVTMDHRGYIRAEPALRCPGYAEVSPYHDIIHTPAITSSPDPLERIEPVAEQVQACHDKLVSEGVDPAQYNQYTVSRDVDEIRHHLGDETIRPYGSSTGSGTALSYVQYYPEAVDAAIFGWPWFTYLRSRPAVDEFYTAKQRFTFFDGGAYWKMVEDAFRERSGGSEILEVVEEGGFLAFTSTDTAIHEPGDFKGLRFRAMDPSQVALYEAMGASGTPIPWTEVYSALQTGVADGQMNPPMYIIIGSLYEVQDYLTRANVQYSMQFLVGNGQWLNSLSEDDRQMLEEAVAEANAMTREDVQSRVEERVAFLEEEGMEVITPTEDQMSAFREEGQPAFIDWLGTQSIDQSFIDTAFEDVGKSDLIQ